MKALQATTQGLTENLPAPTEARGSVSKLSENSEWKIAVSDYVTQCWDTFPRFGDDNLKSKIKSFVVGLEDYSLPAIDYAFRRWLKECNKMPYPSDIGNLARARQKHLREMQEPTPMKAQPQKVGVVPWHGKSWQEIKAGYMPQLEQHLIELEAEKGKDRADQYLNYLKGLVA